MVMNYIYTVLYLAITWRLFDPVEHDDVLWRAEVKRTGSRVKLPGFWFWPCVTFSNHLISLNFGFLISKMGIK